MAALRDMLWHPFPTCDMGSDVSTGAGFSFTTEPTCPPFYRSYWPESGSYAGCAYDFVITVSIEGAWWSDVYGSFGGVTSTHYSDRARTELGSTIDPTYDKDAATWVPPAPPPKCEGGETC